MYVVYFYVYKFSLLMTIIVHDIYYLHNIHLLYKLLYLLATVIYYSYDSYILLTLLPTLCFIKSMMIPNRHIIV